MTPSADFAPSATTATQPTSRADILEERLKWAEMNIKALNGTIGVMQREKAIHQKAMSAKEAKVQTLDENIVKMKKREEFKDKHRLSLEGRLERLVSASTAASREAKAKDKEIAAAQASERSMKRKYDDVRKELDDANNRIDCLLSVNVKQAEQVHELHIQNTELCEELGFKYLVDYHDYDQWEEAIEVFD